MKVCSADGCDRKSKANDMCNLHYKRWRNSPDYERTILQSEGARPERVAELKAIAGEGSMDERAKRLAQALMDGRWVFPVD